MSIVGVCEGEYLVLQAAKSLCKYMIIIRGDT